MSILLLCLVLPIGAKAGDESCCDYDSPGNPYLCHDDGNCTWWAWYKRPDLPSWSGDANSWLTNADNDDIPTGDHPVAGAIVCLDKSSAGHVAYVEYVNPDGSFYISQMDYYAGGCETYDTVEADDPDILGFIYGGPAGEGYTFSATQTGYSIEQDGPYYPGDVIDCEVYWRNDGTATWDYTTGTGKNYVELGSCNSSGTLVTSYLYASSGLTPSWLNDKVPCTMEESSVTPGNTATFSFQGKIPTSTTFGQKSIYFGPVYDGEIMDGFDGNGFTITVVEPVTGTNFVPFAGDFNGDGKDDIGLWTNNGGYWYVALSTGSSFQYTGSYWDNNFAGTSAYAHMVGKFDGNGYEDVGAYRNTDGNWYVSLSNGSSSFATDTDPWKTGFGASTSYQHFVGDFGGDSKTDIGLYKQSTGQWYVALNLGGYFTPNAGADWDSAFGATTQYKPFVGDFAGDNLYDIGVYNFVTGSWYIAVNRGGYFEYDATNNPWKTTFGASTAYDHFVGDFDGNGRDDVLLYRQEWGKWFVALNEGWRFTPNAGQTPWLENFGGTSAYTAVVGDFDGDGYDDVAVYSTTGDWYVRLNRYPTYSDFDPTSNNAWISNFGIISGSPKLADIDEEIVVPTLFNLRQNYPNPFNPATVIQYSLPEATHVRLVVYNIMGQHVATLVDGYQSAGEHSVTWGAQQYASGVYFYRLQTGTAVETKKMLLLK